MEKDLLGACLYRDRVNAIIVERWQSTINDQDNDDNDDDNILRHQNSRHDISWLNDTTEKQKKKKKQ